MIDISSFPANDSEWSEEQWHDMLIYLNEQGLASYKDMASTVLSALNPPQVGTAVATNKNFQSHYPKGKTMQAVMRWFYDREGVCVDCGTHLELQADHIIPKETFANKRDADYLDILELRCRRCNVIKRPSHKNGGKTYRSILIDGEEFEFSTGFTDLHTVSYQKILSGEGFEISESRNAINIVYQIRNTQPVGLVGDYHPLAKLECKPHPFKW